MVVKRKQKRKDFVLDFLKKVSEVRSNIFENKVKISPREQTGILLYLNAAVISLVIGTLNFILVINTPLTEKIKILPLLWIILGFASIFAIDWYLGKRDISSVKVLFIITLFHFLTASAYLFSGILSFIGVYFIFESKFTDK